MRREIRRAVLDGGLQLEACWLQGFERPFPNHFHEYYVLGLLEGGERRLSCMGREYALRGGHMVLFRPGDSHACFPMGGKLDYRSLHIPAGIFPASGELPGFSAQVLEDREAAGRFRRLHEEAMAGRAEKEALLDLLELLGRRYGRPPEGGEGRREVRAACAFLEERYEERISLEEICRRAGLSKSALLRAFVKEKGVTPYAYLENVRVARARELLAAGASPAEAALGTGFSDQSHFTRVFGRVTGLSPGAYGRVYRGAGPA